MLRNFNNTKLPSKTRGFSLVELILALGLGVLVTAGIVQLFVGNNQTYNLLNGQSRLQESARYALDFVGLGHVTFDRDNSRTVVSGEHLHAPTHPQQGRIGIDGPVDQPSLGGVSLRSGVGRILDVSKIIAPGQNDAVERLGFEVRNQVAKRVGKGYGVVAESLQQPCPFLIEAVATLSRHRIDLDTLAESELH